MGTVIPRDELRRSYTDKVIKLHPFITHPALSLKHFANCVRRATKRRSEDNELCSVHLFTGSEGTKALLGGIFGMLLGCKEQT